MPTTNARFKNCPHCGSKAVMQSQRTVYGKEYGRGGMVWVCENYPACDSYVGCHQNSNTPLGTLANAEQRRLRKEAHSLFDPIWKNKEMTRNQAYHRMAEILGIEPKDAHISQLSIPHLYKLIRCLNLRIISREIAKNKRQ